MSAAINGLLCDPLIAARVTGPFLLCEFFTYIRQAAMRAAMLRQIALDRSSLLFPEIPDWQNCLFLS